MLALLISVFLAQDIQPGQSINDAVLMAPQALRIDHSGRLLVVDSGNHRVLVCDPQGEILFSMGREGSGPGEFNNPGDVGVTPSGRILVADRGNRRVQLFDEGGGFLNIINIPDQSVGTLLVTGENRFILGKNNGYGLKIVMNEPPEERRFREFYLEGKTLRRFGQMATHANPMLRTRLNYGPMALIKGVPVLGGSITSQLIFYEEKERTVNFKPGFEPREAEAKMVKFKNAEGYDNYSMTVQADWICISLAAIADDALLMLRATEQSPDVGRPPVSLVKFDLDGNELKRYPGIYEASSLAVTPDGKMAWIIIADDNGWSLKSIEL